MNNRVVIISGATATGKTALSFKIADMLTAKGESPEIVNFDSLLFYKGLDIGTAKPTKSELALYPHHLINLCNSKEPLNAADYTKLASTLINKLLSENKSIILVGGSGFYLRALIKGMYDSESTPPHLIEKSQSLYNAEGILPFINFLKAHDPKSLKALHENDHYRIRRAVEFFWTTGSSISTQKDTAEKNNPYDLTTSIHAHWKIQHFYLLIEKDAHQKIIRTRSEKMLEEGLLKEVENLLKNGHTKEEKPLQSIGYKESIDFLEGKIKTKEALIDQIVISTRQLAKSQKTFFKKIEGKVTLNPLEDNENLIKDVLQL